MVNYMKRSVMEIVKDYADRSDIFNEHFKTKYPEVWHIMSVYGSMGRNKVATRRLLGLGYTNGPLPYIDQMEMMGKIHESKNNDLVSFFRTLIHERDGLCCSDLGEVSSYIDNIGVTLNASDDTFSPVL